MMCVDNAITAVEMAVSMISSRSCSSKKTRRIDEMTDVPSIKDELID